MILGTLTLGLSGYVFLSVIGHDRFPGPVLAALTSTYLLTNIVGPGVFVAVEQEASRAVSELVQRGRRLAPTLTRIAAVTGLLVVAVLVVVAAAAPTLADRVLEGDAGLLAAIGLTVIGSGAVFLIRGVVAGRGRFGLYAATLLVDGGVRLAGMLALVAAGDRTPALFALVLAAGPVAAALVVGGVLSRGRAADPPGGHASDLPLSWVSVHRSVALLTVSSVLAFGIANLAPVAVTAALPQAPAVAAGFAVGLVLTRIPLLAMGPVQALLLPRMTRAVARHDDGQLRGDLLRGLAAVGAFGVVAGRRCRAARTLRGPRPLRRRPRHLGCGDPGPAGRFGGSADRDPVRAAGPGGAAAPGRARARLGGGRRRLPGDAAAAARSAAGRGRHRPAGGSGAHRGGPRPGRPPRPARGRGAGRALTSAVRGQDEGGRSSGPARAPSRWAASASATARASRAYCSSTSLNRR